MNILQEEEIEMEWLSYEVFSSFQLVQKLLKMILKLKKLFLMNLKNSLLMMKD